MTKRADQNDIDYSNDKPVDFRTKLALKLCILMIRILMPYRYEHQFDAQLKEIAAMIEKVES